MNQLKLWRPVLLFSLVTLQACPIGSPPPIGGDLDGRWDLYKIVTPTRTMTPATLGYRQDMNLTGDGSSGYAVFYRNDTLHSKFTRDRTFEETDNRRNTVIDRYYNVGYIKYYLKYNQQNVVTELETSEFLKQYTQQADSVRYFYKYAGSPRPL